MMRRVSASSWSKGYSRDHRPELNQAILELICENQAGIPVYMQALSGNTNDQKAFKEVAKAHLASLKAAPGVPLSGRGCRSVYG